MAVTIAMLLVGLALQLAVFGNGGHVALSDLPRVFLHRDVGPGGLPYIDRPLEYPVGSGILLYLAASIAPTGLGILLLTAAGALVLSATIAITLANRYGAMAWRWALATPLLLLAFQNWDMFAIGALVGAVVVFERHRDRLSGALLGVGAAIKLFPGALVAPLAALRWAEGDRRGARRLIFGAVAAFGVLNLPFMLLNAQGWFWPFDFQSRRQATWGSAWHYVYQLVGAPVHGASGAQLANVVSFVALVAGIAWLSHRTMRRRLDPMAIAAAAIAIFLLSNKVYSPSYDNWPVLFFVVLPMSRRLWLSFCGVSLAVYASVYGYFHAGLSPTFVQSVLPILVLIRTVILVLVVVEATRWPSRSRLPGSNGSPTDERTSNHDIDRSTEDRVLVAAGTVEQAA